MKLIFSNSFVEQRSQPEADQPLAARMVLTH